MIYPYNKTKRMMGWMTTCFMVFMQALPAGAQPTLTMRVVPDLPHIEVGPDASPLTLIARVNVEGVQFQWSWDGPGMLGGDLNSRKVQYQPPATLERSPAQVCIRVTVTDEQEHTVSEEIKLTLIAPTSPAPATTSMFEAKPVLTPAVAPQSTLPTANMPLIEEWIQIASDKAISVVRESGRLRSKARARAIAKEIGSATATGIEQQMQELERNIAEFLQEYEAAFAKLQQFDGDAVLQAFQRYEQELAAQGKVEHIKLNQLIQSQLERYLTNGAELVRWREAFEQF